MHLNKQRLVALEELKKAQREKQLLLERLEQLEAGSQAGAAEDICQRQESKIIYVSVHFIVNPFMLAHQDVDSYFGFMFIHLKA